MSRHSVDVIASGMEVITKKIHKDLGGGHLGLRQIRRVHNIVTDATLQNINGCMASELAGRVQEPGRDSGCLRNRPEGTLLHFKATEVGQVKPAVRKRKFKGAGTFTGSCFSYFSRNLFSLKLYLAYHSIKRLILEKYPGTRLSHHDLVRTTFSESESKSFLF